MKKKKMKMKKLRPHQGNSPPSFTPPANVCGRLCDMTLHERRSHGQGRIAVQGCSGSTEFEEVRGRNVTGSRPPMTVRVGVRDQDQARSGAGPKSDDIRFWRFGRLGTGPAREARSSRLQPKATTADSENERRKGRRSRSVRYECGAGLLAASKQLSSGGVGD